MRPFCRHWLSSKSEELPLLLPNVCDGEKPRKHSPQLSTSYLDGLLTRRRRRRRNEKNFQKNHKKIAKKKRTSHHLNSTDSRTLWKISPRITARNLVSHPQAQLGSRRRGRIVRERHACDISPFYQKLYDE